MNGKLSHVPYASLSDIWVFAKKSHCASPIIPDSSTPNSCYTPSTLIISKFKFVFDCGTTFKIHNNVLKNQPEKVKYMDFFYAQIT